MSDVKINGITYSGVERVQIPLADDSGNAVFTESESSGNAVQIGSDAYPRSMVAMFHALEQGTAVMKKFKLEDHALPNTETLIFETGLDEIKGLMFVVEDFLVGIDGTGTQNMAFYISSWNAGTLVSKCYVNTSMAMAYASVEDGNVTNGTIRVDGGNVYCTAKYNDNGAYTPFQVGTEYTFVAW